MSEVHEQEAARAPRVGVHALATAAAGALPVPGLDRYLRALTRGAALRRVASRRGVRLTPDARRILAAPPSASSKRRVAGMLLRRFAAPMRLVARAEDATAVLADAHLLDGYLREAAERGWRRRGAPLDGREKHFPFLGQVLRKPPNPCHLPRRRLGQLHLPRRLLQFQE